MTREDGSFVWTRISFYVVQNGFSVGTRYTVPQAIAFLSVNEKKFEAFKASPVCLQVNNKSKVTYQDRNARNRPRRTQPYLSSD